MGILQEPSDVVCKLVSMPRWQREWVNAHRTINFSGLVQTILIELIREHDPEYYAEFKKMFDEKMVMRRDVIQNMIKRHPSIKPNIF